MTALPTAAQNTPNQSNGGQGADYKTAAEEYSTVADAVDALSDKPGVIWHTENGWPIAVDEAELAIWSFSPPDYDAYPAVVKRQAVPRGPNSSTIVMSVICEAPRSACDELVRTFAEMNGLPIPE